MLVDATRKIIQPILFIQPVKTSDPGNVLPLNHPTQMIIAIFLEKQAKK
jgi:hypothetical protein